MLFRVDILQINGCSMVGCCYSRVIIHTQICSLLPLAKHGRSWIITLLVYYFVMSNYSSELKLAYSFPWVFMTPTVTTLIRVLYMVQFRQHNRVYMVGLL